VKELDAALVKRHHIVHRSGPDVDGTPVTVTAKEITNLCSHIEAFPEELESSINSRGIDASPADAHPPS
jgi:hypothetical protein